MLTFSKNCESGILPYIPLQPVLQIYILFTKGCFYNNRYNYATIYLIKIDEMVFLCNYLNLKSVL